MASVLTPRSKETGEPRKTNHSVGLSLFPPLGGSVKRSVVRCLLLILAGLATLAGCGGSQAPPMPGGLSLPSRSGSSSSPIQHVVMIVQENRTFDNFFAGFPGANGATRGKERVKSNGTWIDKWVKLKEQSLLPNPNQDIGHCYYAFITAYDGGKMDGFNLQPLNYCPRNFKGGLPAKTYPYQYVNPSQIAPYWDMAQQYVLADAMFQTQGSGSFTAHQDLIRGGSALAGAYGSSSSLIDTPTGEPWGCDATQSTTTDLITISLKWEEDTGPPPCTKDFSYGSSSYTTLADLLDAQSIAWKYYSPCFKESGGSCGGGGCTGCNGALLNAFDVIWRVRNGPEWGANVSMPETNIFNDISAGSLPAVSWVIPADDNSDHLASHVDNGPAWVASIVNAIGQSSYWNSTAIVIVWDDWGGLYDHASPSFLRDDQGGLGFRVPMIVVSAYAKQGKSSQGYVSHTKYEFGSILKYIETNFNLPSLGTTDARAASIGDVFNYNQSPRPFTVIPSAHDARYFITHHERFSHGDPE
jgi:phospholipase C